MELGEKEAGVGDFAFEDMFVYEFDMFFMVFEGYFQMNFKNTDEDGGDQPGRLGQRGGVRRDTRGCFYCAGGCKAYAKGMFFMCNRMIIVKKRGKRINYYSIEGGSVGKRLGAGRH